MTHRIEVSPPAIISADLLHAWQRSEKKPEGWTLETAQRALIRYKRYLALIADEPGRPYAPTFDIDEMWHLHMLSPVAYVKDCMRLFGHVLDHDGGFGKEDDELPVLQAVFESTAARWMSKYGEDYAAARDATKCWHDCQSRCWHACKSLTLGRVIIQ